MNEHPRRRWWLSPQLRWILWFGAVAVSTAMLIGPSLARALRQQLDDGPNPELDFQVFLLSKTFHVTDYMVMTVLTAWLAAPRRLRGLLLLFLSAHGAGTEFIQQFVEGRVPTLHDIGLNHLGIVLGIALTWRWWRRPEPERSAVPA